MLVNLLTASAHASDGFLSRVTLRPTIGLNISSLVHPSYTSDALVSFKIGALADYAVKTSWGFRSGILFTGQGEKHGNNIGSGAVSWSYTATDNLWYLEIPLDAYCQYTAGEVTFKGFTGFPLEFGLFGNYKLKGGDYGTANIPTQKHSAFDDFSRFALAWNIGLEATWHKISLGIEYNRHLTNDVKSGKGHFQLFSINVGYTL